ncbi:CDC73-domain-containing protein [Cryptosporidium felis]|nr:CDC73-domain-containing protein [Cryptosporidium felis]
MAEDDKLQVLIDPLILLKDVITRGKLNDIHKIDGEFYFEFYNCALNTNTPTRCRNRRGESLTLEDLYLFITATKSKKYTMKLAQDSNLKFINILERKNILEFLEEFCTGYGHLGIPSEYSMKDLAKYECINSDFSLQLCRLLDKNKGQISNISFPWVKYLTEMDNLINTEYDEKKTSCIALKESSISLTNEDSNRKRKTSTISQIYPINIDFICQGIDMYTRINSLLALINDPIRHESKKKNTGFDASEGNKDSSNVIKPHNAGDNRSKDSGLKGPHSSVPRTVSISKSISSYQSRSTLLAYLNSNNLSPIILVPPSSKSPITMNNVVQFLRDKEFVDPSLAKRNSVGNEETVTLNFGSGTTMQKVTFRILESTLNFRKRDWYSLIAVFLTGAEWQLQSFPFRTIQDIFTMVKGYHITYDSEPIPENIRKWNVDVVRINRTNRHNDLSVWFQFMESIESVLASSRDHSKLDRSKI